MESVVNTLVDSIKMGSNKKEPQENDRTKEPSTKRNVVDFQKRRWTELADRRNYILIQF